MKVRRTSRLAAPLKTCVDAVMTPALLRHVARPWVEFEPVHAGGWPARWQQGPFAVRMKLFGWLPLGEQIIDLSQPPAADGKVRLRDNGHSALIRRWDHWITLEADGDHTWYSDEVDVEAGVLTPVIWLFAWAFYRHRQRRWHQLIASGQLERIAEVLV